MTRKFIENDLTTVIKIWFDTNTKVHNFIPKEYWRDNYTIVREKKFQFIASPHYDTFSESVIVGWSRIKRARQTTVIYLAPNFFVACHPSAHSFLAYLIHSRHPWILSCRNHFSIR